MVSANLAIHRKRHMAEVLRTGKPAFDFDWVHPGTGEKCNIWAYPVFGKDEEIIGLAFYFQTEDELEEESQKGESRDRTLNALLDVWPIWPP